MRLEVLDRNARRLGKGRNCAELVAYIGAGLLGRNVQMPAAEAHEVRQARVCAKAHAVPLCKPHGFFNCHGIARVPAAGDVDRRNERDHLLVRTNLKAAVAFAQVAV